MSQTTSGGSVASAASMSAPKKKSWLHRDYISAYMFLLPAMIFFIAFVIYPMIKGIYTSFFNYTVSEFEFVGLNNYIQLLTNPDLKFLKALTNTLLIVMGNVPIVIIFSLFVARVLYKKHAIIRSIFRGIFYLPAVCSIVSITVVWGWIYHPNYGILNYVLGKTDVNAVAWLGDQRFALLAILLVLVTVSVGQPIILYIAALGNIPPTYHEAAEIDGAKPWDIFRHVTWPLLMPTTLYIAIITTINSFQIFSLIQLLTSGGPYYATTTVMYQVYERAFQIGQFGMSSAMGVILAVIVILISVVQYRYLGSDVEY